MRTTPRARLDRRQLSAVVLALGTTLLLGACASSTPSDRRAEPPTARRPAAADQPKPGAARPPEPVVRTPDPPLPNPDRPSPEDSFDQGLVQAALDLLGSPYRYAGTTPRGFDCSGLVYFVFASFGIELPRTTDAQASLGAWIPLDEVDLGDLLFFTDGSRPSHVGMVTSRPGQPLTMVHSSSSRGVIQTVVEESDYWLERLRFARRNH